jgi:EmrB/QacA subfamily drug resistance transporter
MSPHHDRPHPMRSLMILGGAALAFSLAQTMLIPALGELTHRLDTDASGIAWVLTGYLLAAAVATPVAGRLGDMFGKRRLLVSSLLVFGAGSTVAALGSSLEVVVAGRVLQGFGGGIFPLCFGIIRDEFPRERVAGSIGLISAIFGIGGGAGLIGGGLIADHLSYHWIFWLGTISAALAAVAIELWIPESPERTPGRVDVRGAALLGAGLAMVLIAISRANDWGWGSTRTLVLIAAGLVVLAVWVAVERRTEQPLADIPTLMQPPVLMTNIATLFVGFGMFGSFLLIPQLAEAPESTGYGFGTDATGAGLLLMPGALVMLFAGPLSGALGSRFGSKLPLALGAAVTSAGLVGLGLDHGSQLSVLAWAFVMSAGIGLAFAAMANLIVEAVPPEQTGEATGINTLTRSVGAAIGSQVCAAILAGTAVSGSRLATDGGFTAAFLLSAGVAALAAVIAVMIPRGEHQAIRARTPRSGPALAER